MNFKNLTLWDIAFTKWSVFLMTLFLVSISEKFTYWVVNTHWAFFLVPSLVFAIKPIVRTFKK
jgi:hypothetical protein